MTGLLRAAGRKAGRMVARGQSPGLIPGLRPGLSIVLLLGLATAHAANPPLHAGFNEILAANVVDGFVNYPGIAADPRFDTYIERLAEPLPGDSSRDQMLAFYINAYNALAIKGILDGYSPSTLLGRYRYFKSVEYEVGGQTLDLYDLEREIILAFGEPRIHFAIVCASASCPALRPEAYTAQKLEAQLDDQARKFIKDSSKNAIDPDQRTLRLSKIFDWFPDDFSNHSGSVQKYIAQYVDDPAVAAALRADEYRVRFLKYDWRLNGAPIR